jgi:hypothetical protein
METTFPVPENTATIYLTSLTHISLFAITMKAQCVGFHVPEHS